MKLPSIKPNPDYKRFIKIIRGEVKPKKPPFAELFLDEENVRLISEEAFGRAWMPRTEEDLTQRAKYWDNTIEVYHSLGYDYVRVTGSPSMGYAAKTRPLGRPDQSGKLRVWTEEGAGIIETRADFEAYSWPKVRDIDIWDCEYVSTHLPEGMGMVICPSSGFLEVVMNDLMGYTNLCFALIEDRDLVADIFDAVGKCILRYYEKVTSLGLPNLFGFFQGDDMGYKNGTLIPPEDTRLFSLKWHKSLAELAHKNDLLYILHSCGQLEDIMEDLITDVKIDAKHSFEDEITPVTDFHKKYGSRIGVLGGIDLDKLCRYEEQALRKYVRDVLDVCMPIGRYALGSGNSVANYVPLRNYFIMLEEGNNY